MRLRVCHLYPDLLNLYGDRGNVLVFCQRAAWRGIDVEIDFVSLRDHAEFASYDFIFIGGGADMDQDLVSKDLRHKGPWLIEAVESGVTLLSICGGYQLLGRYYKTHDGSILPGVGLFDAYTEAGKDRLKGNVLLEVSDGLKRNSRLLALKSEPGTLHTLVGFENHSGRTFLGPGVRPLGRVLCGNGNNGNDFTEGACYKNSFGTYLHGPLLSKNPHFADLLLTRALSRHWGEVRLAPLDDTLEVRAHSVMKERIIKKH